MINRLLRINKNSLLGKGLTDTNYYFIAQTSAKAFTFISLPIFARLLTPEQFALYDLFILSTGIVLLISSLGIDSGIAIKLTENKENNQVLSGLLCVSILLSTTICLVLWTLSYLLLRFDIINLDVSPGYLNGLFIYSLLFQYNYLNYNFTRWLGKAKSAALISFLSTSLGVAFGLIALFIGERTVTTYIYGAIGGTFAGVIFTTISSRDHLRLTWISKHQFIDLMKLSIPFLPTYFSSYLMQLVDRVIITTFFGMSTLGTYAFANRVAQVPNFIIQVIASGFRPILLANAESADGKKIGRQIFSIYWISLIPVNLITVVLAKPLLKILGGNQFVSIPEIFPYIIMSVLLMGSFYLFGFGYSIKRKTYHVTWISLSVVALTLVFSLVLIKLSGVVGVAQATSLAALAGSILYIYLSERLFRFHYDYKIMIVSIFVNTAILIAYSAL